MRFAKMHGAGNDFVVVDARGLERDWSAWARAVCDRHYGVGADGILLVLSSARADLRMRMFNPDGSEAEMCGNGIRCFAKFALERGIVPWPQKALRVETLAGVLTVDPLVQDGRVVRARVGMGAPRLRPQEIPVDPAHRLVPIGAGEAVGQRAIGASREYFAPGDGLVMDWHLAVPGHTFKVTGVSMGNPHAVAFLETPVEELPLGEIGPQVEYHPMFPKRVNFEVVNVVDRRHLNVRVWERGAGLTMACGSGASAAAVAARLHGYTDEQVDITMPGGVLTLAWDGAGEVFLEGPVEQVFQGEG
jgi:diaminopimelate epimerase